MNDISVDSRFIRSRTVEIQLRDSTPVVIRPIVPEDRDRLRQGLERLSPRSRFLRFLGPISQLSEKELGYLTEIDYKDHFAWVALAQDEPGAPGIGVARYIRDRGDSDIAEAAVTVVDAYQGRGLGTVLIEVLADTAQENGIRRFRGYVSGENRLVLEAVGKAGTNWVWDQGVVKIEVPLPLPTEKLVDSAVYMVLRAAARGELPV
ncbi:MAG: GNAT family N-acetyltransferase [Acidobacteria bacterium]|nr:GNAT family N-acetyltransferase [Acidobacteriota bacterium]